MYFSSKTREFTKPVYSETEGREFRSLKDMEDHAKNNGLVIRETPLYKRVTKKYAMYINDVPHIWSFEKDDWVPVKEENKDEK